MPSSNKTTMLDGLNPSAVMNLLRAQNNDDHSTQGC